MAFNVYHLPKTETVQINNAESLSAALPMLGNVPVAIVMPAAWDTANLTFQVSHDNGVTYQNYYRLDGTEYIVVAAASRTILLEPAHFLGFTHLKIRSGTSGTPVNQTANRVLTVVARPA